MKSMWKRVLSMLLCVLLVASLFTGCAGKGEEAKDPASEAAPNAAPGEESASSDLEYVELTWYVCGPVEPDSEAVFAKMNEYLKEKLNCTINIIAYDYGSYDEMLNIACTAGEEFDLMFTSDWLGDYYGSVRKGYLLPLDDLMEKYGQGYMECVPQKYIDNCKVDGQSYGLLNYQIMCRGAGVGVLADYAEKYNFDLSAVKTMADMEPLFAAVKADDPTMYGYLPDFTGTFPLPSNAESVKYENFASTMHPAKLRYDDMKVINIYEEEEFVEQLRMLHSWYEKGYIRADAASLTDLISEQKTGKYVCWLEGSVTPGAETTSSASVGYPVKIVPMENPLATRDMAVSTLTGISSTSKNPERAMMFLNLLFTDEYLFNLLCHGIEGEHWTWYDEANKIVTNLPDSGYNPAQDWAYGCQFNAYLREGQEADTYERTIELNETATPSALVGFSYDNTQLKTENAMVDAVIEEYIYGFMSGTFDPDEKIPEFLNALDEAGWDKVIADMQAQLDAFLATK